MFENGGHNSNKLSHSVQTNQIFLLYIMGFFWLPVEKGSNSLRLPIDACRRHVKSCNVAQNSRSTLFNYISQLLLLLSLLLCVFFLKGTLIVAHVCFYSKDAEWFLKIKNVWKHFRWEFSRWMCQNSKSEQSSWRSLNSKSGQTIAAHPSLTAVGSSWDGQNALRFGWILLALVLCSHHQQMWSAAAAARSLFVFSASGDFCAAWFYFIIFFFFISRQKDQRWDEKHPITTDISSPRQRGATEVPDTRRVQGVSVISLM